MTRAYELGVIGAGNMAEAIVRGALEQDVIDAQRVLVADPSPERRAVFEAMGAAATDDNAAVVRESRCLMLAIKPQMFDKIADVLADVDAGHQIVLSIMTGHTTEKIAAVIGDGARVIRVMPNTPLLVGRGMSGICCGAGAREGDETFALQLFGAAGEVVMIDEDKMDALTVLSGSGPAYLFYLAQAMIEAGESMGFSPERSAQLTRQTLLGAAELLAHDGGGDPIDLRRRVTSPGGTTEAAIKHMESHSVREHIVEAIRKAEARGRELGS